MEAVTPSGLSLVISAVDEPQVLEAVAPAPRGQAIGTNGMSVGRQRHAHGPVAGGVRDDLPAGRVREPDGAVQLVGIDENIAGVFAAGVGLEQRRGVRAECRRRVNDRAPTLKAGSSG